jgi:hypothetical protein
VKIEVEVFCFVTPCIVAVGYGRFGGPSVGSKVFRNVRILPHPSTVTQCRRPRSQFGHTDPKLMIIVKKENCTPSVQIQIPNIFSYLISLCMRNQCPSLQVGYDDTGVQKQPEALFLPCIYLDNIH